MGTQKEQLNVVDCTGNVSAEANSSSSMKQLPIASSVENTNIQHDKKITPEDALSRVMGGEELVWSNCPNCNSVLAVYIRTSKPSVALGPIVPVHQVPLSTDDR